MGTKDRESGEAQKELNQPRKQVNQRKIAKQDYTGKPLKCMYTNADSLKNKFNEFTVRILAYDPDIICVNEVKPKYMKGNLTEAEFSLKEEGYNMFPLNIDNNIGRGMLVYTKLSLKVDRLEISGNFEEAVWIKLHLNGNDSLLIGCFYRSGSGSEANNNAMRDLIDKAMSKKCTYTCCIGDFNYPDINWSTLTQESDNESSQEYKFLECIQNHYLTQHLDKPTRVRGTDTPNILDLLLTDDERIIRNIDYQSPLGKSDHAVLQFEVLCYTKVQEYKRLKYYFDSANYEAMKRDISNINWDEALKDCASVDNMWDTFYKVTSGLVDQHVQHRLVTCNKNVRWSVPMDNRLRAVIRKKHRSWTRYMENRSPHKHREFCKLRNKVTKLTKNLRREFEKKLAKESKSNPKAVWKYIHSKSRVKEEISDLYTDPSNLNSPTTSNCKQKANLLADFYSSVFTVEPDGDVPTIPNKQCDVDMPPLTITEDMVEKKLAELNPNKSPGPDSIHPRFLKELAKELSKPLAMLFNKSLNDSKLPEIWKRAKITAIFKKGDRKHPGNYRPVSLTSVVCKVLEKIVREHVIHHFKNNKLFTDRQYGFLDGRSTSLQLLKVLDQWTDALDGDNIIDCIYMDYAKAFDKVPHRRLLSKLSAYGVSFPVLQWIQNFLTSRFQQVTVKGELSELKRVTSGIPQGSVLGPLLFVVYINDLPDLLRSQPYLFADDTKIFRIIRDNTDQEVLQQDLNKLHEWSSKWLLSFHPQKCKCMRIAKKSDETPKPDYKLDSHVLEWSDVEKDIGLLVDETLSFDKHLSSKVKKANSMFGLIRRIFQFMDKETFKPLYQSMVRVHLDYVSSVWAPYKKKDIKLIEQVQRRATKQIPGLSKLSYQERLKSLELPTLSYRRIRGDMIEVYKIIHEIYDPDAALSLPRTIGPTRGHSLKLFQQRSTKDIRKNYFTNRVVKIWNSLPDDVVKAPSVNSFKNQLDKFWSNQPLKYQYDEPYLIGTDLKIYLSEED